MSRQRSSPIRTSRVVTAAVVIVLIVAVGAGIAWWLMFRAGSATDAVAPVTPAPTESAVSSGPPAPRADGLPAATSLGASELRVHDLAATRAFYQDAVGLTVLEEADGSVLLGRDVPLLRLIESNEPAPGPRDAGLYHTAILYADAPSLADALVQIATIAPDSYQGAADHTVSRAFYFGDPEGNGLELYVDAPRAAWTWTDGKVTMGSAPLDPNEFMRQYSGRDAAGTATMGHMHLKVGDLDAARAFYADTLGFDVVAEADGALFYSAGGYHHHLATNVWQSAGAGPRSTDVGLGSVTVVLPEHADIDAVAARLDATGVAYERLETGLIASDPWGNRIRFSV